MPIGIWCSKYPRHLVVGARDFSCLCSATLQGRAVLSLRGPMQSGRRIWPAPRWNRGTTWSIRRGGACPRPTCPRPPGGDEPRRYNASSQTGRSRLRTGGSLQCNPSGSCGISSLRVPMQSGRGNLQAPPPRLLRRPDTIGAPRKDRVTYSFSQLSVSIPACLRILESNSLPTSFRCGLGSRKRIMPLNINWCFPPE